MKVTLYILGGLLIAAGLAYHFAALAMFNLLVPKDAGSSLAISGHAYGADPRQKLDIYRPEGTGPFPVLLFAYGGSWDSGRRQDYEFVARAFAAKGFLTVIPDYRLVPQVHYPEFVHDVADAAAAALKLADGQGGDLSQLFFAGHSAGGYIVLQVALLPDLLESRGIPRTSLKGIVTLAAPADVKVMDFPKTRAAMGRHPNPNETQPVYHARPDAPPLLMLHGRNDTTVRPYNAENMTAALRAKGAAAEVKLYDTVEHIGIMLALSRPLRDRAPVLEDTVSFFQKYR